MPRTCTYPGHELLFLCPTLPSHWNSGWDSCDGRNAAKDSPTFQTFLKLFLSFSYFTKPGSPPARVLLLFMGNDSDWGKKYAFLNKHIMLYSMKAKKIMGSARLLPVCHHQARTPQASAGYLFKH